MVYNRVRASLRLSPRARVGWALLTIGAALFYIRRFDEAVQKLLVAIQEDASLPNPYRYLAACYAHMVGSTTHGRSSGACGRLPAL
jgi:predicted Zn-dependent protease